MKTPHLKLYIQFDLELLKVRWSSFHKALSHLSILLFFILIVSSGCKNSAKKVSYEPVFAADSTQKKVLIFGVASIIYYEEASKMVAYLNHHFGGSIHIKCVASKSHDEYLEQLQNHRFDFTLTNGLAAIKASQKGYSIIGKYDADSSYYAVIFVNKDSLITRVQDLKNKTLSLSGRSTLAGSMMPLMYLHKNGLNVNKDLKFTYTPSFESTILNVYLGKSSAGAAWVVTWRKFIAQRPEILQKVQVKWNTPTLPHVALLVNNNLDQRITAKLLQFLLAMGNDNAGIAALQDLGVTGFETADLKTYDPIKVFEKEYKSLIN
jgi:phosphonate transport system substrate-binding protein